jgi:D-sedoheptulose 7-phosphate isomerase
MGLKLSMTDATVEKSSTVATSDVLAYYSHLAACLTKVEVSDQDGGSLSQGEALTTVIGWARAAHACGRKLMFIGNGGSAAIAAHMATDYSKAGNLRAMAFNDGAMLTCLSNDLGYEQVFAKQIELHGADGDMLIAISSGGRSASILEGVAMARRRGCRVVTLSGFGGDNPLRRLGDVNFHLASDQYGYVEIGHLAICHAILDFACGLKVPKA